MATRKVQILATEFNSAVLAHIFAVQNKMAAFTFNGRYFAGRKSEAEKIAAAGVEMAYICDCPKADGSRLLVTIPVN